MKLLTFIDKNSRQRMCEAIGVYGPGLKAPTPYEISGPILKSKLTTILRVLDLIDNGELELSYYMNCCGLEHANIGQPELCERKHGSQHDQRISLTKFLSCWPKISELNLDGYFLETPKGVLLLVKSSSFYDICYDLDELARILCLLRSSINLCKLAIHGSQRMFMGREIIDYLGEPGLMKQSKNKLRSVKMINFQGWEPELLFVKLLLANGHSMESMYIQNYGKGYNPVICLDTSIQLMRVPRALSKAEMIYQPCCSLE
ncbi:hypothetical protein ACH5RR_036657 [Cinchona calisaya]|uniref:FBD domain-containing protein n=1 Tax=Cinchona calisaya TaxID=153742 RepID=A0ABD2Y550_9GENT